MTNKIMAVSLQGIDKYKAFATYDGERLIIIDIQKIAGPFGTWKGTLLHEIKTLAEKDYTVLVDEKTDHFAEHGHPTCLEDIGHNGRVNFYNALDMYYQLSDMGHISIPDTCKRFRITEDSAEKIFDEQGRIKYNINFDDFKAGQRTMLLCVLGAEYTPMGIAFLNKMYEGRMKSIEERNPLKTFLAITRDQDLAKEKAWDKIRGWDQLK